MATLTGYSDRGDSDENGDLAGATELKDATGEFSSDELADDQSDLISDGASRVSFQGKRRSALSLRRKICVLVIVGILVVAVVVVAIVAGKKSCNSHPVDHVISPELWDNVRLPSNVAPLSYQIDLHPDLTKFHVQGTSTIEVNVSSPEDKAIVLHAKNMNITSHSLHMVSGSGLVNIPLNTSFFFAPHDFYVMPVLKTVQPGIYQLKFVFEYTLGNGLVGFYRSEYKDGLSGQTRYVWMHSACRNCICTCVKCYGFIVVHDLYNT